MSGTTGVDVVAWGRGRSQVDMKEQPEDPRGGKLLFLDPKRSIIW